MKNHQSTSEEPPEIETRRSFLKKIGSTTAAGIAGTVAVPALIAGSAGTAAAQKRARSQIGNGRAEAAFQVRVDAAQRQFDRPPVSHPTNGDEARYPEFLGSFSKALPHNGNGEVDTSAYNALLAAVVSGNPGDYEAIPLGGTTKLVSPQGANTFSLEACDSHSLSMPAPPALESFAESGEMLELYWQAVLRDLSFSDYENSTLVSRAVRELSRYPQFRTVRSNTLFRGETTGDHAGPYISQFLQQPIPFGATTVDQRYRIPVAGDDQMTAYADWLDIQNGAAPAVSNNIDPTPRYIRNGRDMGEFVHQDTPSQIYYSAALIMLGWGNSALSVTNPYLTSATQDAFVQFGVPHVIDMVTKAALAGIKCAWYQKWNVHRRLRPEAFGGIMHNQITGATSYPVKPFIAGSFAVQSVFSQNGTYLLPMAYPEGSPTHPAYPAGHATVAGACSTILKAFFNEDFAIPSPVVSSADGLSLDPYTGGALTIGNEVNKLAANISLGRNFAGVHWRTDGINGMRLGEKVAIELLADYAETYSETFGGFTFTKFDGTVVTI